MHPWHPTLAMTQLWDGENKTNQPPWTPARTKASAEIDQQVRNVEPMLL